VSLIANVALSAAVIALYMQNASYSSRFGLMAEENEGLNQKLMDLQKAYEVEKSQLDYYKQQAEYYSRVYRGGAPIGEGLNGYSRINVVAVRSMRKDPFTVAYEGVVLMVEVELRQGEGRILIDTKPKIGIDLQSSLRTAVLVAENATQASLNNTDVILTVSYSSDVEIVDGPSAGLAVTIGLIAAIRGESLGPDVYATGTISPDGSIGLVGGVLEKAEVAASKGAKEFLVPRGQGTVTGYREVKTEPVPGFTIITYESYQIDLKEYLTDKGYNIEVVEVYHIIQAYKLATQ